MMPPIYHRTWQYLKYKMNHAPQKIPMRDGSFLEVKSGQHLTSIRNIAKGVGYYDQSVFHEPSTKTIQHILEWLEKQGMISKSNGKGNRQYTLISLLQWEKYQSNEDKGNSKETAGKQLVPINKNDQEGFKKKDLTATTRACVEPENLSSGESDGMLPPDSLRSDGQLKDTALEISQTPERGRDALDRLCDRFNDLRTIRSGRKEYPKMEDYQAMEQILKQIPVDTAMNLLDQCFEDYDQRNARSPGKRISSFRYCMKYMTDHYEALKTREKIKKKGLVTHDAKHPKRFVEHGIEYEIPF